MNIYERIKALRIANGMSQYDLAVKVGYEGRSAISKVEQGKRDISQSMIVKYADALGVTPEYLLYGDEKKEKPTDNGEFSDGLNVRFLGRDGVVKYKKLTPELIAYLESIPDSDDDI